MSRVGAAILLFLLVACARMGEPPGGPQDAAPPVLIGTYPESTAIYQNFKGQAEFRFNEIVSEGGSPNFGLGSGDLEKLVVLSPTTDVPVVGWKKSRIVVRPREGWQPNRVYRIELLPGVADLRSNRSAAGRIITFTTGAPLPTRYLEGRVVDWNTGRPEILGLVEATQLPDTLRYRTRADSSGRFRFGPLPDGVYVVAGALDQNRNNRRDPRESFDTVTVAPGRDSVGELWAFKHDTVAARLQTAAANDSLSVAVQFNQQLNPYQRVLPDSVRVRRLPDSVDLGVEVVVTKEVYDSIYTRARSRADSAKSDSAIAKARADSAARADSIATADSIRRARQAQLAPGARRRDREAPAVRTPDNAPLKTKPPLSDRLVVRVRTPLVPGSRYVVQFAGVESVSRVSGRMLIGFEVPVPKPPDTTKAKPDSTIGRRDSAAARPPPPPPPPR